CGRTALLHAFVIAGRAWDLCWHILDRTTATCRSAEEATGTVISTFQVRYVLVPPRRSLRPTASFPVGSHEIILPSPRTAHLSWCWKAAYPCTHRRPTA